MGILYIVATPIGNIEDITLRAIRILREADFIACEDTRKLGLFLQRLKIPKHPKFLSYYEDNEFQRIPTVIQLLGQGKNIALVSSSGTPLISDPGFKLVRECVKRKIKIEVIPGPSAVIAALVNSGLPTDKFLFLGFLPLKKVKREKIWKLVENSTQGIPITVIIYEAPHRLLKTLQEVKERFGDIEIVICRELTKMYEEIIREKISQTIDYFQKNRPKGEFVLLFSINTLQA